MRLLLDTHVWLWFHLDPQRLGPAATDAVLDTANEPWLSPASVWEMALLADGGRIALDRPPAAWLDAALAALPVRDASLTRDVALRSRTIDLPHQDPVDRFLAATAAVHGLTLVTADRRLLAGSGYDVLAA